MYTIPKTSTTDMEVTSIRLEKELKDRLKKLANRTNNKGYQALIRDILWNYVQQKVCDYRQQLSSSDIRASVPATAQQQERCILTDKVIKPHEAMLLGLTTNGDMVPLSIDSLKD